MKTPVPDDPRTSFNVGVDRGRHVGELHPRQAAIKVDLRSEAEPELGKLEATLRATSKPGWTKRWPHRASAGYTRQRPLNLDTKVLGVRPGGELADNSPLLAAVQAADDYLGNRSRLERSSTDANIPLAPGIPAIAIGAGGQSAARTHSANGTTPRAASSACIASCSRSLVSPASRRNRSNLCAQGVTKSAVGIHFSCVPP